MREAATLSAVALTLVLALRRPRLPYGWRLGPGAAAGLGVSILLVTGGLAVPDLIEAGELLWRPVVALASIMVMTGVAARVGLLARLAQLVLRRAADRPDRLFGPVFGLSFATAAVCNNDAAVLVLTPVVVALVRQRWPQRPQLLLPFAFAVFSAAGVAPFLTSNPMNTVMAGAAGIDFNTYAIRMVPVALVAALLTFAVLRWLFASALTGPAGDAAEGPAGTGVGTVAAGAPAPAVAGAGVDAAATGRSGQGGCGTPGRTGPAWNRTGSGWTGAQWQVLVLLLMVLAAYPVSALVGVHVFVVALVGAVAVVGCAWWHRVGRTYELVGRTVAWEVLVFLVGMFLLARGLQEIGVVNRLAALYADAGPPLVGVVSAAGSAVINNHSMALTNLLAIGQLPHAGPELYLAAMVGGDLGPRLLPVGSLAGLMWLATLGRLGVVVPLRRFVTVGVAVTVPALAASLLMLRLW